MEKGYFLSRWFVQAVRFLATKLSNAAALHLISKHTPAFKISLPFHLVFCSCLNCIFHGFFYQLVLVLSPETDAFVKEKIRNGDPMGNTT